MGSGDGAAWMNIRHMQILDLVRATGRASVGELAARMESALDQLPRPDDTAAVITLMGELVRRNLPANADQAPPREVFIRNEAPQTIAAPSATRTPSLPRPARCGFEELAPSAHTIADMISASTASTSPTVIDAPTIFLS